MLASKKRDVLNAVWSAGSDRRGTTQRRWFARGWGNVSALEGASSELRRKKAAIVDIGLEMSSRQYPGGLPLHQSRWETSLNGACWNKATKNRGVCAPNRHARSRRGRSIFRYPDIGRHPAPPGVFLLQPTSSPSECTRSRPSPLRYTPISPLRRLSASSATFFADETSRCFSLANLPTLSFAHSEPSSDRVSTVIR